MLFYSQVDYKNYLLDFKSLNNEEAESNNVNPATLLLDTVPTPVQTGTTSLLKPSGHHTMEFFEMCAALIIQLAR